MFYFAWAPALFGPVGVSLVSLKDNVALLLFQVSLSWTFVQMHC